MFNNTQMGNELFNDAQMEEEIKFSDTKMRLGRILFSKKIIKDGKLEGSMTP